MEARMPLTSPRAECERHVRIGVQSFAHSGLTMAIVLFSAAAGAEELTKAECVDANEHASVLRKSDELLSARAELERCRSPSCPAPVRDDCAAQLTDLESQLPELQFHVHSPDGTEIPDVTIWIDGVPNQGTAIGRRCSVDPGDHLFELRASGFLPRKVRHLVLLRAKDQLDVQLEPVGGPMPGADDSGAWFHAQTGGSRPTGLPGTGTTGTNDRQLATVALGGVGIATGIAGAYFGIRAKKTYDTAVLTSCSGRVDACTQSGVDGVARAHTQAGISTALFIGSLVSLVAAAALLLTDPEPHAAQRIAPQSQLLVAPRGR